MFTDSLEFPKDKRKISILEISDANLGYKWTKLYNTYMYNSILLYKQRWT